eukprot:185112-Amphidinium_carterae.1
MVRAIFLAGGAESSFCLGRTSDPRPSPSFGSRSHRHRATLRSMCAWETSSGKRALGPSSVETRATSMAVFHCA